MEKVHGWNFNTNPPDSASERIAAQGPAPAEVIAGALASAHAALLAATPRQREILAYIKVYQAAHPQPSPTVREIGEAVGLKSSSTIWHHLDHMARKGLIRVTPNRSRSIEIIEGDL